MMKGPIRQVFSVVVGFITGIFVAMGLKSTRRHTVIITRRTISNIYKGNQ